MDVALELLDPIVFDKAYVWALPHPGASMGNSTDAHSLDAGATSLWARDNIYRQSLSIMLITQFGACSLYFIFSALSYYLIFDRRLEYHPRFLKNQVRQEIKSSMTAVPFINLLTLPWFLAEVRGHSLLYGDNKYGWSWLLVSTVLYMAFNDVAIYWIHRLEHHPSVYKYIHKPHHKWIVPTPWAALAFHPLDGYVQSLPYHIFVFLIPMNRYLYTLLFVAVQIWTIFIHDGDMISGHWTEKFINSPAHHTLHHMYFTVNYGQYFTWCDSFFDSHRAPQPELDPIHDALKVMRARGLVDERGEVVKKRKGE
ncbi:c-5 sterol desaturase [Neodidymelliopsis sp. IMI 364377]|nr:c-5 sterol desaturase [Neodidymelliopsis sp. IMI 364377]